MADDMDDLEAFSASTRMAGNFREDHRAKAKASKMRSVVPFGTGSAHQSLRNKLRRAQAATLTRKKNSTR